MYSVQHVLWRGAMALSLLVVGGVGAGIATPEQERVQEEGCVESWPAVAAQRVQPLPHYQIDTVVVVGTPLPDEA